MAFHLHPAEASHMLYSFPRLSGTSTIVRNVHCWARTANLVFFLFDTWMEVLHLDSFVKPVIWVSSGRLCRNACFLSEIMFLSQTSILCLDTNTKAAMPLLLPREPPACKSRTAEKSQCVQPWWLSCLLMLQVYIVTVCSHGRANVTVVQELWNPFNTSARGYTDTQLLIRKQAF